MTIFWLIEEKQLIAENRAVCFGLLFRFGACGVCRLRLEKSQKVIERHKKSIKGGLFLLPLTQQESFKVKHRRKIDI
jgi:hypothetical protein